MELIDYMKKVEGFFLKQLENKLQNIIEVLGILSDYWILSEDEIRTNNIAFQWYHKIPQILEDNRIIVENKTQEFQDSLKSILVYFHILIILVSLFLSKLENNFAKKYLLESKIDFR